MKVLLINPPQVNEILDNTPSIVSEGRGSYPPLGLLYIAAYLEKNAPHHDIAVLDCQIENSSDSDINKRVREFDPDIIGISVMTMTLLDAINVINICKQTKQLVKIVLGGPHPHIFPNETIQLEGVDLLVIGEGEITFKELLDTIENDGDLQNVQGIVYKREGKVIHTEPRPLNRNLDVEIPFPARHLVPYKKYSSVLAKRNPATTMFTSRGCPYKCTFCDRPHLGKIFRFHSSKYVVDEIEHCTKMGINEFIIYDDTFTINKQRVKDICNEIIKRNLDVGFDIRARIDTVDEEMLQLLKRAGCHGVHFGIESGTAKILKVLNKGIDIDQAKKVIQLTKKYGIPVLTYFIIGNPTETIEDIRETFKVMRELEPDFVHLAILTPFPSTNIYFSAIEQGIISHDVWQEFAKNPRKDFIPPYWEEHFTREQLHELAVEGYKQFYLRPSYILRRLKKINTWVEFWKNILGGLQILFLKRRIY